MPPISLLKSSTGSWEQTKRNINQNFEKIQAHLNALPSTPDFIEPRVGTITSSPTPAINVDEVDVFTITKLAEDIISFSMNLLGDPVEGQSLTIRIFDDGTSRSIVWGPEFSGDLPTSTTPGEYLYVRLRFNSHSGLWDYAPDSGGASGDILGVNVMDYGAAPDGTDSYAGIQAAIDVAQATHPHKRVFFPGDGTTEYRISRPITITDGNITLEGTVGGITGQGTNVRGWNYIGPVFHISSTHEDVTTGSSLVTGSGVSLELAEDYNRGYIDFYEAGESASTNGLSAMTIECFFKATAAPSGFQVTIFGSGGSFANGAYSNSAFNIRLNNDLSLHGNITIGGSVYSVNSAAGVISTNTVYHVALTYDGSNVRLFYGTPGNTSTLVGTTAASGTITQEVFEVMCAGDRLWGNGNLNNHTMTGYIDSIRLSNSALYTATYTVGTSKLTAGANTLFLENFDNETEDFTVIYTAQGTAWVPKHPHPVGNLITHVEIRNLEIQPDRAAGIWMYGVCESIFYNVSVTGCSIGIFATKDCFENTFERVHVINTSTSAARAGIALCSACGITELSSCVMTSCPISIYFIEGSVILNNCYTHGDRQVVPLVGLSGMLVANNTSLSQEDLVTTTQFRSSMFFSAMTSVSYIGGSIETHAKAVETVYINGGQRYAFENLHLLLHASTTQIFNINATPSQPIEISAYRVPAIPWCSAGGLLVNPGSAGAPTIASGFGTSPAIGQGNYAGFVLTVGTGGSASSGVLTMPFPALNGWVANVNNLTAAGGHVTYNTRQTASSSTTVTLENQTTSTGAAVAWGAGDVLAISCYPY